MRNARVAVAILRGQVRSCVDFVRERERARANISSPPRTRLRWRDAGYLALADWCKTGPLGAITRKFAFERTSTSRWDRNQTESLPWNGYLFALSHPDGVFWSRAGLRRLPWPR